MEILISKLPYDIKNKYYNYEKTGKISDFITEISGIKFWVNRWGSCQYSSALAMFITLYELNKYLSFDEVLIILKIFVDKLDIKQTQIDIIKNILSEDKKTAQNIEDIFNIMKNASWNLWSAVPTIFHYIFPECKINASFVVQPYSIQNNNYDIFICRNNYMIGIMCWILIKENIIPNDECLRNFDT